ncbi:Myosin type-2 heavy chain 1 [Ceratobasidium sp. 428]|nr:Myosin type-2 heavy chain 1 [Ceratobasidium sp. 428]
MVMACKSWGLSPIEFKQWTTKKQIATRSEKIVYSLSGAQATVVTGSVSKFVYAYLFEWLVAIVNKSLSGENGEGALKAERFIGVLELMDICISRRTLSNNLVSIGPTRICNKKWD